MKSILAERNAHPRDPNISLNASTHIYTSPVTSSRSVTSWMDARFEKFDGEKAVKSVTGGRNWNEGNKYWGMTGNEMRCQWQDISDAAKEQGTILHGHIESFLNNPDLKPGYSHQDLIQAYFQHLAELEPLDRIQELSRPGWYQFLEFVCDTPHLIPYRTEWVIYHGVYRLTGTVDTVYWNPILGTFVLADWKHSAKPMGFKTSVKKYSTTEAMYYFPDTSFWKYAIQLNLYKLMLEEMYETPIAKMIIFRFHPELHSYESYTMPELGEILKPLLLSL